MKPPSQKLLYADTQSLIYAYEKDEPTWRLLFEQHFASGHCLVLTEENLFEFAQSPTPEIALSLARRVLELKPVWLRSFIDIQADEVRGFFENQGRTGSVPAPEIYRLNFEEVSQIADGQVLGPIQFVELFSSASAKLKVRKLRQEHVGVLNTLTRSTASGNLTKGHLDLAFRSAILARLERGSDLTSPLIDQRLSEAVRFCVKNRKWLLRECPSFAAEHHLSNYRSSSPKRNARPSDSVDLTTTVAALPYVDTVITNDGFLYAGLEHVKRNVTSISTKLIRNPSQYMA